MNTDLSVAPEIARLAAPLAPVASDSALPRTDGRVAGDLASLAASPQRWWDLVRFHPAGPVRIPVPDAPGSWLLVLPPGLTTSCDCAHATAVAGEAAESTAGEAAESTAGEAADGSRPLRPGRIRVHGRRGPHQVRSDGPGYSVTLHSAI